MNRSRLFAALLMLLTILLIYSPSHAQSNTPDFVIIRDRDSFTLYIPPVEGVETVSLEGLVLETTDSSGTTANITVEIYGRIFRLPFDALPAPMCLHLAGPGLIVSLPAVCQNLPPNRVFARQVEREIAFWTDPDNGLPLDFGVYMDFMMIGECLSGNLWCPFQLIPSAAEADQAVIAYSAQVEEGNREIFLLINDSSNIRQLTENGSTNISPSWAQDADLIIYASDLIDDELTFGVFQLSTGSTTDFNPQDGEETRPVWSPSLDEVVYVLEDTSDFEIMSINMFSAELTPLTDNNHFDDFPVWMADASGIAFISDRNGLRELFVMKPDGSDQRLLVALENLNINAPAWSPDGTRIAFTAFNKLPDSGLYVANADGSNVRRIVDNIRIDSGISWSPDGTRIVYAAPGVNGVSDLFIVNADGTNPINITNTPIDESDPAWRPAPSN